MLDLIAEGGEGALPQAMREFCKQYVKGGWDPKSVRAAFKLAFILYTRDPDRLSIDDEKETYVDA